MKFLICGIGSIGLRHLRNLKFLGHKDIAIYRSGKGVMPGVQEEVEGLPIFNSLSQGLDWGADVCMITNPTSLHVETAISAAERGCHLYIEKPLSNTLEGLDRLENIVRRSDLISLITYQFRHHPHLEFLKKEFSRGVSEFGRPISVNAEWSEYLPDWHPWEDFRKGYSARSDLGGGVLLTQIHPLNYLQFIFGKICSLHKLVMASHSLGIDVDDTAEIVLKFKNGVNGHIHIDFLQKPRVHRMKIVTSNGRFEWDYHQNTLLFINHHGQVQSVENEGFERNDMFINMLADYIKCVTERKATRFDLSAAITELQLLID